MTKMKRFFSPILIFTIIMVLVACSDKADSSKPLAKVGIAPYELSESEKHILQFFGMENNSQIISFHAPKGATILNVNIYKLEDGENWSIIGGGAISIDKDMEPDKQLTGIFTMQLKEDFAIEFNINDDSGRYSYKTDEIVLDTKAMGFTKRFLQEFQEIEINEEIPIALMIYDSGTSVGNYLLQDYFDPSKFDGVDLVQVVTLKFT